MSLHIHNDVQQGSDAWLELRRGIVTASTVGQLLTVDPPDATTVPCPACNAVSCQPCTSLAAKKPTPLKTVHGDRTTAAANLPPVIRPARNDYSNRLTLMLVTERITGQSDPRENFTSNDMLIGQLDEPLARDVYSGHFAEATEVGFMVNDGHGFPIGYSPDGLVGDDGLIEIKSPRAKEHLRTILAGEVPDRYMAQLQCGLLVSGRKWIDYVSFFGGMPLYVTRVLPDPKWAEAIVDSVAAFEQRAVEMVANYETATRGLPNTEPRVSLADLEVI
jgi:hypothetical protein